ESVQTLMIKPVRGRRHSGGGSVLALFGGVIEPPLGLLRQRPDMQQMIVCGFALAPELTDEAAFDTQPEFGAGGVQRKGDVLFVHGALLHRMWQWWRGASSNTVGKAATIQFHNHNVKPFFGFLTC